MGVVRRRDPPRGRAAKGHATELLLAFQGCISSLCRCIALVYAFYGSKPRREILPSPRDPPFSPCCPVSGTGEPWSLVWRRIDGNGPAELVKALHCIYNGEEAKKLPGKRRRVRGAGALSPGRQSGERERAGKSCSAIQKWRLRKLRRLLRVLQTWISTLLPCCPLSVDICPSMTSHDLTGSVDQATAGKRSMATLNHRIQGKERKIRS